MHTFNAKSVTVAHRGGARAVRQFDMDFEGDCLAVLGLTADGKTSLIDALSGLVSYDGEFILDGQPLPKKPDSDKVQAILEDYCLLQHKTVRQNIEFPLKIRQKNDKETVENVISEFGLAKYADVKVSKLADNIKPYIAVSRLTLVKRDLYLFDDILKPLHEEDKPPFVSKLKEIFKRLDGMKIYATANVFEARELGDKILVLYGGVIEQYGTYDQLVNNPVSRRIVEIISDNKCKFGFCILRESNGRLMIRSGEESVAFEENSADGLISKDYIGREVQVGEYEVGGVKKYIVTDPETDKSIMCGR